jgi:asparagine N-glycosylation enzyme membrane subunit Stt3
MYTGLKHLHSFLPYLLLTVLVLALVKSFIAYRTNQVHTDGHRKNGLIVLILAHIQLLIGMALYFISPKSVTALSDMGAAMKDSTLRLYALEHPLMMIIAIVFITMAYSKSKKEIADSLKHKVKSVYYLIALVLILSRIPWSVWL